MSNVLVIKSQWAASTGPSNVLIIPSQPGILLPANAPNFHAQPGPGFLYINDFPCADCASSDDTNCFGNCAALFHLPGAPFWYEFFASDCGDSGTDAAPGYSLKSWASWLVNPLLAPPQFSGRFADIPTCNGPVPDSPDIGCIPPPNADFWTIACDNLGTPNFTPAYIDVTWRFRGTKPDPPGPTGFNVLEFPFLALNPTLAGIPLPKTVGCGCLTGTTEEEMAIPVSQIHQTQQMRPPIAARRARAPVIPQRPLSSIGGHSPPHGDFKYVPAPRRR